MKFSIAMEPGTERTAFGVVVQDLLPPRPLRVETRLDSGEHSHDRKSLTRIITASTVIHVERRLTWDETKRRRNLRRHGLDFAQAGGVLDSCYRLDIPVVRKGEARVLSISYALGFLAVLTVVHTERDGVTRIISFRRASAGEREVYDAWLENECDEP